MGRRRKVEELEDLSAAAGAASPPPNGPFDPVDYPHLSPEEIMAQTEAIEAAKAEKKRQRAHRKRIKELEAEQLRKSRRVPVLILIITVLLCLGLMWLASSYGLNSSGV